ncbi:MAG: SDR family oxidoreductase [Candidatus Nealsonbacteria bacterium]|nr:SDR family oxidoreductase [Candidatus Nealsonbacteria bacterium]
MKYHLLTGATGLLGGYLLRDSLLAGLRMAVLVRANRAESARQRVESLLSRWERSGKYSLLRPVVLEGDLSQPDLGLEASDVRWVSEHCDSVIHNAASLSFHGSDREGEPWRSNLGGTRRVLDLCRRTGIRRYHHVSTAYVCGQRGGVIHENELDCSQQFGNDYEQSKFEAETLVRTSDFIDPPTVFRPAIIVGDSQTGYTTTYHGFYAPLKLAHTLVSRVLLGATGGDLLAAALGFVGKERKNFVPVDWVSAVMVHVLTHAEHHGKTYHLAPSRPVLVRRMAEVMHKAVESYSTPADQHDESICDGDWFERMFCEQMEVYREYWQDDPQFDLPNTTAAAPHLPCPDMDDAMMMRLMEFAIRSGFGRPRPRPIRPEFDVQRHLDNLLQARNQFLETPNGQTHLGLEVLGPGGGQWELMLEGTRAVAASEGVSPRCSATFRLDSGTYRQLAGRRMSVARAVEAGQVAIDGNGMPRHELAAALQSTVAANGTQS